MAYSIVDSRGVGKLAVRDEKTGDVLVVFSLWKDHKPGRPFPEGALETLTNGVKDHMSKSFMRWAQNDEKVCLLLADYAEKDIVLYQAEDLKRVFPRNNWFKSLPKKEEEDAPKASPPPAPSPRRSPSPPRLPVKVPLSKRWLVPDAMTEEKMEEICKRACREAISEFFADKFS